MSAQEAVSRFIKDGDMMALGGFTVNRNPMSLTREIIRRQIRDLHLVLHSHGQAMDLLIGAGCVKRLEIAYGGTGRFAPTSIRFKNAVQKGLIEIEDYSNFQMTLRFLAGSLQVPFIPTRSGLGTDLVFREGFSRSTRQEDGVADRKMVITDNPFGSPEEKVMLLPALNPDVTLLHVQTVGDDGTVRIKGLTFADLEQAKASRYVLVSCEEIVPADTLREDPDQNSLPPFLVDAVIHSPWGAHPTACHFFYDYDPGHLKLYRERAGTDQLFQDYLEEWVIEPGDQESYLDKLGAATLQTLKADPRKGYAIGLDRR